MEVNTFYFIFRIHQEVKNKKNIKQHFYSTWLKFLETAIMKKKVSLKRANNGSMSDRANI